MSLIPVRCCLCFRGLQLEGKRREAMEAVLDHTTVMLVTLEEGMAITGCSDAVSIAESLMNRPGAEHGKGRDGRGRGDNAACKQWAQEHERRGGRDVSREGGKGGCSFESRSV